MNCFTTAMTNKWSWRRVERQQEMSHDYNNENTKYKVNVGKEAHE